MLFDQVSSDIVAAMKAKDKIRLMALRNIKKFFIEAKTQPGANDELTDENAIKILANGEISKALTVKAAKFSASAVAKIEAAGGKVETL